MSNSPYAARPTRPAQPHNWEDQAACLGLEDEFAPPEDAIAGRGSMLWLAEVAPRLVAVCATCPVLAQCEQRRAALVAAGGGFVGVMAGQVSTGQQAAHWRTRRVPQLV